MDPLAPMYPWYTPFQYAGNNPIRYIDLDGLEESEAWLESYYKSSPKIDMSNAPESSARTAEGAKRNKNYFWDKVSKEAPEMLSPENKARIRQGQSPVVDEQWLKFNNAHIKFKGQTLEHHHLDHGNIAVALPQQLHRGKGYSQLWHSFNRYTRTLGKAMSLAGSLLDFTSDDPHSLNMLFSTSSNNYKEGKIYYDVESGAYFQVMKFERTYDADGNKLETRMEYDVYDSYEYDDATGQYRGVGHKGRYYGEFDHKTGKSTEGPMG